MGKKTSGTWWLRILIWYLARHPALSQDTVAGLMRANPALAYKLRAAVAARRLA